MSAPWGPGWCPPRVAPEPADRPNRLGACRTVARELGFQRLWGFQEHILSVGTEVNADGTWARDLVIVEVPRQNGKSVLLMVRGGLGVLRGEACSITAQRLTTAERIWNAGDRLLSRHAAWRILEHSRAKGQQRILQHGLGGKPTEWLLVSDTPAAARSHTLHTIMLDEAAWVNQRWLPAATPTRVTVADAQIWQVSNSGDEASRTWTRTLRAALRRQERGDDTVAVFGWGCAWDDDPYAHETWAKAIPTLDLEGGVQSSKIRADIEDGMEVADLRREYLGLGSGRRDPVLTDIEYAAVAVDDAGDPTPRCWITADTSPDATHSALGAVWRAAAGTGLKAALLTAGSGDSWLWQEALDAVRRYRAAGIVVDGGNPAAHLAHYAEGHRVKLVKSSGVTTASSAAALVTAVRNRQIEIESSDILDAAAADAIRRPLDKGWAIDRDRGGDDEDTIAGAHVSALVGVSLGVGQVLATPAGVPIGGGGGTA